MRKLIPVFLLLLWACAPGQVLDTPNKQLLAADAAFTAVVNSATNAIDTGVLDPASDAGKAVKTAVITGKAALDAAHLALQIGDMDAFQAMLAIAQSTIAVIRQILAQTATPS